MTITPRPWKDIDMEDKRGLPPSNYMTGKEKGQWQSVKFTEKWICINYSNKGKEFNTKEELMNLSGGISTKNSFAHFLDKAEINEVINCFKCGKKLRMVLDETRGKIGWCVFDPFSKKSYCLDCIVIKDVYENGTWVGTDWSVDENIIRQFRT